MIRLAQDYRDDWPPLPLTRSWDTPRLAAPASVPAYGPDCLAFFKWCRGWLPVPLLLEPHGCEPWAAMVRVARWAVCEDSPFCPTNHTLTRQQTHASNPCGYDKAPKVVAFGNGRKEGISLKDTAECR